MTPEQRRKVAVAHLRSIPKEIADHHVYMGAFMRTNDLMARSLLLPELLHDCGTTACAAGWLCKVPALRAEGLTDNRRGVPTYEGRAPFESLASFFGLKVFEAVHIFGTNPPLYGKAALDRVCDELEAI